MADGRVPCKEEDYPDNDRDPSEVETLQKAEHAYYGSMNRQATVASEKNRGPPAAYTIPTGLYDKACKQNDQLTDGERDRLLSRGDLVGKALAHPESITRNERYELLDWPAPEVVEANVKAATGNSLHTPRGLFDKIRALWESSRLEDLNDKEVELLANGFRADDSLTRTSQGRGSLFNTINVPGSSQAHQLMLSQEGAHHPSYALASAQWLDPSRAGRQRARQALRAGAQNPGSIGIKTANANPAVEYIVDEMADLQDRWSQGEFTDEEYRGKNTTHLHALRLLARRLDNDFSRGLPDPTESFSTGNLPTRPVVGLAQIIPSVSGRPLPPTTLGDLAMAAGTQGVSFSIRGPPNSTMLEDRIGPFPRWSMMSSGRLVHDPFRPVPTRTYEASDHQPANLAAGDKQAVPPPPPRDVRSEVGPDGRLNWPPMPPLPNYLDNLEEELRAEAKDEGLQHWEFSEYVRERWENLNHEERVAYEARHEAARMKAWEEYDKVKLDDSWEEAKRLSKLKRKYLLDLQMSYANNQGNKFVPAK